MKLFKFFESVGPTYVGAINISLPPLRLKGKRAKGRNFKMLHK